MTEFFIKNYKFTMVLTFAIAVFGSGGLMLLKPEAFPDVNLGTVVITTVYGGASAEDIETKITKPIEDELRSVSGLKKVKSVSQAGLSVITTEVDIDRYSAKEVIEEMQRAVDNVTGLPQDLPAPPDFLEIKTDEFPVIELAVTGPNQGRERDRIADLLKEELEDNNKISGIRLTGFTEQQFNIEVDPLKLEALHVGLDEVVNQIKMRNLTIPGGELEKGESQVLLKIDGKVGSTADLEELLIRSNFNGQKIRLGDIATVTDGNEDALTLASHNGAPATLLTIQKKAGENLIQLAEDVRQKIEKFSKDFPNHKFEIYNNEGKRVDNRINVLSSNGVIGLILVVFFLFIFLPGRVGIMAAISLPMAIFATFGAMYAMGLTLNTITILALVIAIGMLVDNAVVIAENFSRLRNSGLNPMEAAKTSIQELWAPITATALTTIAAFLPMLVTSGVIGQFIQGIPIVVTVALVISLMESFFLLPMRLAAGKRAAVAREQKSDWFTRLVIPTFDKIMAALIRFRYGVFVLFGVILFGSIYLMTEANKLDLFPAEQTEIYISRLDMPAGSRIETTDQALKTLASKIKEVLGEDALHVVTRAGDSSENPTDPRGQRGPAVGLVFVFVTEEAKNNRNTSEMLAKMRKIEIPGSKSLSFQAAVNGPPIGAPVTVTFRSNNMTQLAEVAKKIKEDLKKTAGVFDVEIDDVIGDDEITAQIDYEKTARVGLNLASIGNTLRTAIAGQDISDINLNNTEVDLFVRFRPESRENLEHLEKVKIMDQRGNLVPVSQLVTFKKSAGSAQIKRFDFKRAKTVTANIDSEKISAFAANEVARKTFSEIAADYPDVSIKFGGEGENINESMKSLSIALILSILGIFSLLVLIFNSFLKPLIILTTIPLGLVGFSVAFFLQSRPISFLALIGIVGLGGIIVNSGIVLISFIERARANSTEPLKDILVRSTGIRLRAVIVTSLTTVSGLLPTAYGIGGADEFIIPMTMSLAWGLTSGTILALLWVPCAYMIVEDFSSLFKRREVEAPAAPLSELSEIKP